MRILMLGNSFTYFNDMPDLLAAILSEEVVSHTRGGAYLSEQLDAETEMGRKTLAALRDEKWDYVVLQEQSNAPFTRKNEFLASVRALCRLIRNNGATPLLYATWAYKEGSTKLASMEMSYEEMDEALYSSYHAAAQENNALIADVGKAFTASRTTSALYEADDYHPSLEGSTLAARIIAEIIRNDRHA